jgi:hypothetical protein
MQRRDQCDQAVGDPDHVRSFRHGEVMSSG